jgi:ABC-type dipeptide/oligopeptide/nickel transport system permease component
VLRYIRGRLLAAVPVILGVSVAVFLMLHLIPGDPISVMFADSALPPEQIAMLRHQLGLDDPLPVQYARYISRAATGDLGRSIRTNRPVLQEILSQLPSTLQLTVAGMGVAVLVGMSLGCLAALGRNTWLDAVSMALALVGVSMPSFWLGLMLIFVFSVALGWLPATGEGGLERLIMPAVALGLYAAAVIARVTRSSMLEVLGQEYVRTARAKGLRERVVLLRHALRNALVPVITIIGLQAGILLSGAVVIETVFSRQGIGRLMVNAILAKDFPLVQGAVLFTALMYVLVNLVVDVAYIWADPRIHYE